MLGVMHGGHADDTPHLLGGHTGGTKFWKPRKSRLFWTSLFEWTGGAGKEAETHQPPCQSQRIWGDWYPKPEIVTAGVVDAL